MEKFVKELKRAVLLSRDHEDLSKKIPVSASAASSCNGYRDSAGPLDAAAIGDRFVEAQQLLERGFDPNAASPHGTRPLHTAARCNAAAVADLLIKSGAHLGVPDAAANTPLTLASGLGHSGIVELLLMADSATTANLEHRDSFGNSALHLAAAGDHLEVVNLLCTWLANVLAVNDFGETPLTVAQKHESRRVCEYLEPRVAAAAAAAAETKLNKSSSSSQQLVLSVLQDRLEDVRAASLDQLASRSPDGKTLLHWAAIGDADECAEHLLGCGLSVDAPDQAGSCPLHYAALNGAVRVCRRLLAAGASAGQQEATNGLTPLMLCMMAGSEPVARLLLGQQTGQVRLDAVDLEGETALMLAARVGSESLAKLVVEGSNVMQKNRSGLSAIEISELNGYSAVSKLLEKYRPSLDVYPRRSPKNGYCLVINQVYSSTSRVSEELGMTMRRGSDRDVKRIYDVFGSQLNFRVHQRSDLTSNGIRHEVRRIGCQLDSVDYFVCFILAHGQGDAVFGTDGEPVQIKDIAERLDAEHCRELVGKPKIFFIQACRNNWLQEGAAQNSEPHRANVPDTEEEEPTPESAADRPLDVAKYIDFLFGFSTWEDCVSFRSINKGSLYIQTLCDVIEKHHGQMDLLKMMTRVCHRVGSTPVPGTGSSVYYMVPNIKSSLQKDVKF